MGRTGVRPPWDVGAEGAGTCVLLCVYVSLSVSRRVTLGDLCASSVSPS